MTVKFTKNQIEVLKELLTGAQELSAKYGDNDSVFRGYITTGLESIFSDKTSILLKNSK